MKRWLVVSALALCGCGISIEDFQATAREAKACVPGKDVCVNAGAAKCLCATPVEASKAAAINDEAAKVSCGGAVVECAPVVNPHCGPDGQCTGDLSP